MTTNIKWQFDGETHIDVLDGKKRAYRLGNGANVRPIWVEVADINIGFNWRVEGRARSYIDGIVHMTNKGVVDREGAVLSIHNPTFPLNRIEATFKGKRERE